MIPRVGGGRGTPVAITEVWSIPPLGITVMTRGVEVGPHPWDSLRWIIISVSPALGNTGFSVFCAGAHGATIQVSELLWEQSPNF